MNNLDGKFIAHVATEAIVVGGITIFLYKQNSSLRERVDELEKRVAFLMRVIEGQMREAPREELPPANQKPKKAPQKKVEVYTPEPEDTEDEYDPAELDEELEEELNELCDDEVCLPPSLNEKTKKSK